MSIDRILAHQSGTVSTFIVGMLAGVIVIGLMLCYYERRGWL